MVIDTPSPPRLFENNNIEKIKKKIKELLDEDVFVICVFDADVSRRSEAENKKMNKACELAEKYRGRDSYSEIYKAIRKVSEPAAD